MNFDKELALFYFAYRAFTKHADDVVEKYQLRKTHRRILFFVGKMPGLTVNELLEVLGISKQALNVPMQDLLKKNLLMTKPNERDRRSKKIYLTNAGQALDQRLTEDQIKKMKAYFAQAGDPTGEYWNKVMTLYANEIGQEYIERLN